MGLPILLATFLHTILASSSNTFAAPFPDPELIVQEVNEKVNASRRNLGYFSCGTGNPIDDCWRCDPNWEKNRPHLANCGIGFGRNAIGGRDGKIYVVNDTGDDAVNPKPGTLRYGVIQTELLWIIFSRDMTIKLKQKLIMNSFKTIDGRGSSVHIAGGPCITIKSATNIIIHNINIHDCEQGNHSYIRHSPTLVVYHRESDGDGITVYDSSQIWVDHCSLSNCQDGLIDVTHGSTSVTISNNYFTNHDKVMLLSHSDKYVRDKDMQVTVAYNHFGEGLVERMPRCRHGFFHVVNNDYTRWRMYAIGGSASPTINSEGNRFIAPDNSSSKQVTRREDTLDDAQWRTWNWRTQGDILQNGSYFIPSGSIADADYARASSLGAKPSSMIEMITKGAGSLSCEIGKPC